MITYFNRKEVIITDRIDIQSKVRNILAANNIDYKISYVQISCNIYRYLAEYRIFVKKCDYDRAKYLIRKELYN